MGSEKFSATVLRSAGIVKQELVMDSVTKNDSSRGFTYNDVMILKS